MRRQFVITGDRETCLAVIGAARSVSDWSHTYDRHGDTGTITFISELPVIMVGTWERNVGFHARRDVSYPTPESARLCEQCGKNTHKRVHGIVGSADGTVRWLGVTCMDKATANRTKDAVRGYPYEFLDRVAGEAVDGTRYETLRVIAEAFRAIGEFGRYVSYQQSSITGYTSTTQTMRICLDNRQNDESDQNLGNYLLVAAIAQVWLVNEFVPATPRAEDIKVLASQPTVSDKSVGLLSTIPLMYKKDDVTRDAHAQGRPSPTDDYAESHVGEIGERLLFSVWVDEVRHLETCLLVKMRTEDNHSLVWFTGSVPFKEGDRVDIKATVKAHKEFRGTWSTQVNRAKVVGG